MKGFKVRIFTDNAHANATAPYLITSIIRDSRDVGVSSTQM
jgi:hypothetical protein